jgi:N-acetylmuramoyl-L-alanine amidase
VSYISGLLLAGALSFLGCCSQQVPEPRVCVLIDPGHGGKDTGAIHGGTEEKAIALEYSMALAERLADIIGSGRVELMRTSDIDRSLPDRRVFKAYYSEAIFLSLHADASMDERAEGTRIFFAGYSPRTGTYTRTRDVLAELERYETANESRRMAERFARQLQSASGRFASVRKGGFYVLSEGRTRSVLIELGFLSSPRDRSLLVSQEFLDSVTTALAEAVAAECN